MALCRLSLYVHVNSSTTITQLAATSKQHSTAVSLQGFTSQCQTMKPCSSLTLTETHFTYADFNLLLFLFLTLTHPHTCKHNSSDRRAEKQKVSEEH